jgi:hypothetical protein
MLRIPFVAAGDLHFHRDRPDLASQTMKTAGILTVETD